MYPYIGTCFTTKGARKRHKVKIAGEGNGIAITLMMERSSPFSDGIQFTSPQLTGAGGVSFTISNDQMGANAALKTQGQFLQPGATIDFE